MRRPSEDEIDFPVIVSLQPLHFPFERVADLVGVVGVCGCGRGAVNERCGGGFRGIDCFSWVGVGVGGASFLSAINDTPPWLMEGSVGESGLKKAAGMGGTSSIVLRIRPGTSKIVCRVRAGSSSTKGPRLSGSVGLCRFKLASEGRLDIELPLRASDGDESEPELSE